MLDLIQRYLLFHQKIFVLVLILFYLTDHIKEEFHGDIFRKRRPGLVCGTGSLQLFNLLLEQLDFLTQHLDA